ncbi:endonuclease/exonuclease/phosphatase family protein [Acidiphilium multivorum]|uniref:endonuclease/exonuclease/phosphatase family protein n=1 Tax=Acidiphilium multivorum TaxID=62140 RepID=UPI001F4BE6A3|nr:endonuclease/exonuclease/phosphatase family protein [Acidiphilium multivorum]UNC15309.1 endonuclease/exonuclease/phosphatase family protein [Acidiphilium multivorum]
MRLISWNLLRRVGAEAREVAALIEDYRPDLMLMQEATESIAQVTDLCGGWFYRAPMQGRIYGLAVWSPAPLAEPGTVRLPASVMPGRVPPRLALLVEAQGITFANVHLSHGQMLNRLQLRHIARQIDGPAVIVGDYNAVGPIRLRGYRDVGPRQTTCRAGEVVPFRLDRCMVRDLHAHEARVLGRGSSDHHPIVVTLAAAAAEG